MSDTTAVAIVMAMVLILASVNAAQATNNGLSAAQVRALIKKEVAKIPRVRGPAGPTGAAGPRGAIGPAGMDGMPFLFATVFSDGTVNEAASSGITNENLRLEEGGNIMRYCFSGLPPLVGGQVTLLAGGRSPVRMIDLHVTTPPDDVGNDCAILVQTSGVVNGELVAEQQSFYILLY